MLEGKNSTYPHFQCPNCRAWTDLSAEVDVPEEEMDEWMENAGDAQDAIRTEESAASASEDTGRTEEGSVPGEAPGASNTVRTDADHEMDTIEETSEPHSANHTVTLSGLLARRQASQPASTEIASVNGIDIPTQLAPSTTATTEVDRANAATPDPGEMLSGEGPLTPRNNAGPFVFDGSAGRGTTRQAGTIAGTAE